MVYARVERVDLLGYIAVLVAVVYFAVLYCATASKKYEATVSLLSICKRLCVHRAFDAVLGKVVNAIELLETKCLSVLHYGSEACSIYKTQQNSLKYVLHTIFRKIVRTKSTDVVKDCILMFNCLKENIRV